MGDRVRSVHITPSESGLVEFNETSDVPFVVEVLGPISCGKRLICNILAQRFFGVYCPFPSLSLNKKINSLFSEMLIQESGLEVLMDNPVMWANLYECALYEEIRTNNAFVAGGSDTLLITSNYLVSYYLWRNSGVYEDLPSVSWSYLTKIGPKPSLIVVLKHMPRITTHLEVPVNIPDPLITKIDGIVSGINVGLGLRKAKNKGRTSVVGVSGMTFSTLGLRDVVVGYNDIINSLSDILEEDFGFTRVTEDAIKSTMILGV